LGEKGGTNSHTFFLNAQTNEKRNIRVFTAKDYARRIGMTGFSEALLKNHFTLYQRYVTP
jgi:Fe-Mn family superoxide dismutase